MAGLLPFDDALGRLAAAVRPLGTETVRLEAAHGRVLAAPVKARLASPRVAVSAMDGYAVLDARTRSGEDLRIIGESRPGAPFAGTVAAGEAVRIFTGAPVPAGTDRVIVQEHAERHDDRVRFTPGYGPAWHVRAAGSDFAAGAALLDPGSLLTPRALLGAAAADVATVEVSLRPRVAVLGTGDELTAPGTASDRPGTIPESVTFGVAALVAETGGQVVSRETHADDLAALTAQAGVLLDSADLVVVTGGASVGERDFAKPMFAPHGLQLIFSKLAIKPGKPVWLGTARGRYILGLPGNPTSAMVTAALFLRPLLAALQGRPVREVQRWRHLPLAAPLSATGDRETFVRASWGAEGLVPVRNQDSGAQAALVQAEWLIRRPVDAPPAATGAMVTALAL